MQIILYEGLFVINVILVLIAILLFEFLIFFHEFGHFITAKSFGIKVNEFAIGMGPAIFKFKKNDTLYSLRLFPIGGYCAMEGEDCESDDLCSFGKKEAWKRMIVVAAGAFMNLVLGVAFVMILLIGQNKLASTVVDKFTSDNAAPKVSGLKENDRILSINDYWVLTDSDIVFSMSLSKGSAVKMHVERDGKDILLNNVCFDVKEKENGQKITILDFTVKCIDKTPLCVIDQSFKKTVSMVHLVWHSLLGMVTGKFKIQDMSGPVGIASVVGSAVDEGLKINFLGAVRNILTIMALITVNLGVFNLLPLPALDGGRLVFLLIEAIRGKPVNPKYEGIVHKAGLILLLCLMAFITFNDIVKVFFAGN